MEAGYNAECVACAAVEFLFFCLRDRMYKICIPHLNIKRRNIQWTSPSRQQKDSRDSKAFFLVLGSSKVEHSSRIVNS